MLVTEASETESITDSTAINRPGKSVSRPDSEPFQRNGFERRHIGPSPEEAQQMLDFLGLSSLDALVTEAVPGQIRSTQPLRIPPGRSEQELLRSLKEVASQNQVFRSYIGMGYYDCH